MVNINSIKDLIGNDEKEEVQQVHDIQKPYESIHARQICEMVGEDPKEVDKWVDAIVNDEKILGVIFGIEGGLNIKNKMKISKPVFDINDVENLKSTKEFKELFIKRKNEKIKGRENVLKNTEECRLKKQLHETDIPENLQEKKDRIKECKNIINAIMARKDLKYLVNSGTFMEILKHFKNDDVINTENGNIIYDFIFDYIESSANKKKRKLGQSSMNFFKDNGDYFLNSFIKILNEQERDLNKKITEYKEKIRSKLEKISPKATKERIKNTLEAHNIADEEIEKEVLSIIINKIKKGEIKDISEHYYLQKDIDDMKRINNIVQDWIKKTTPAIDLNNIELSQEQGKDDMIKGDNISVNKDHYYEIKNNNSKLNSWINSQSEANLRGYIFDRLIEYIGIEIINHRIQDVINTKNYYKGTQYRILKTDFLDDTYGGADFVVLFKLPGDKSSKEEIAAIDLLTSRTKYKKFNPELPEQEDIVKKEKIEKAKNPKFLYSTYVQLLKESKFKRFSLTALKRVVVEEDAKMTYNFLSQFMKGEIKDIKIAINKYFDDKKLKKTGSFDDSDQKILRILNGEYEDIRIAS
ncbi:MAG: hypothetical protein WAZ12_05095 [Candidatus Absconditicoccaceae bacterium]